MESSVMRGLPGPDKRKQSMRMPPSSQYPGRLLSSRSGKEINGLWTKFIIVSFLHNILGLFSSIKKAKSVPSGGGSPRHTFFMVFPLRASLGGASPAAERGKRFSHNGNGGTACRSSSGMIRIELPQKHQRTQACRPPRLAQTHMN